MSCTESATRKPESESYLSRRYKEEEMRESSPNWPVVRSSLVFPAVFLLSPLPLCSIPIRKSHPYTSFPRQHKEDLPGPGDLQRQLRRGPELSSCVFRAVSPPPFLPLRLLLIAPRPRFFVSKLTSPLISVCSRRARLKRKKIGVLLPFLASDYPEAQKGSPEV